MPVLVTLYTRPGCHLCQDVLEDLRLLAGEMDVQVQTVDISADPDLLARYQHLIPVVDVQGGPLLTPPLALPQLRQALRSVQPPG
ncbi:MAG: glutaredoxin family protein [Caldilineales bacterium]|nr:glutaredoxin family protein [Caldilineales bacterium]MDW8316635.1 glutaredoxin family protein [Anaerolineae bacterium]